MGKLPLDVRSAQHIPAFENMLSKGPMTIILVYADWCGHCDTFKKNIWKPLNSTPNRTMNMASVHYDQLENTSLKNSAINGYPSLLVVGTDKEPATFDSESGTTNAMPNANDIQTMKKIITTPVSSMKPKENNENTYSNENAYANENTYANENNDESMTFAYNNNSLNTMPLSRGSPKRTTPPNLNEDVIENMYEANVNSVPLINTASRRMNRRNNNRVNNSEYNNSEYNNSEYNNSEYNNSEYNNSEYNSGYNNSTYNENSEDSGLQVNTVPTNTQGTTPILTGGRLYRALTTKNRKKTKSPSKKSRSKKNRSTKRKN